MARFLTLKRKRALEKAHKKERTRRYADRIKAILLLDFGLSYDKIAQCLLLDDQTIRNYETRYKSNGIDDLLSDNYNGGVPKLTSEQEDQLKIHLRENTYIAAKEIVEYAKQTFGTVYTAEGLVHTLKRIGFTYKKTTIIPGKSDPEKQKEFIIEYKQLKEEKDPDDKILFMDGVHPQHNSKPSYGWIEKGKKKEIRSNTGRKRINLNGVIDIANHDVTIREDESINAQSTIKLFQEIEAKYEQDPNICIIADNARYYKCKLVTEYLEDSRITIKHLPPYSPNLNLIERLWKFFYKKKLYNKYYDTYDKFKTTCLSFFENIKNYKDELCTLLTENFQIIGR